MADHPLLRRLPKPDACSNDELLAAFLDYVAEKHDHQRHIEMLKLVFAQSGVPVPHLKDGYSYGFRSFTLTFATEAELRQAEALGCIAAFKQAIQTLYGHVGSKRNPFDADRAVWATYVGWKPSFMA